MVFWGGFYFVSYQYWLKIDNIVLGGLIKYGVILIIFSLLFAVSMWMRNYFSTVYYYIIPILFLSYFSKFSEISILDKGINYLIGTSISYMIIVVLMPIYILRNIMDLTWLFGVLTSILIQLSIEYKLIELSQVSSQNQIIIFLCLSAYSIGTIFINLKIKLGDIKAKEIYEEIYLQDVEQVSYTLLKDCVYYGGEKYEEKIMENKHFRNIVEQAEGNVIKITDDIWFGRTMLKIKEVILRLLKKSI